MTNQQTKIADALLNFSDARNEAYGFPNSPVSDAKATVATERLAKILAPQTAPTELDALNDLFEEVNRAARISAGTALALPAKVLAAIHAVEKIRNQK